MTLDEYHSIQAEVTALERLLAETPEAHVIDRLSLESRKRGLEELLAAQPAPAREPVRARLTFRGKPIVGRYGIFAEFAAAAVGAFSEAVAALGASQSGPLGSRGVLPGREDFRLLITGTAPGSFGFQFEEAPADNLTLFPMDSPLEPAIDHAKAIMRASLGTDDELTDALIDTDPRALDAIRKFLDTLTRNEAVCTLEFKGDVFRFADVEQVRRSMARLGQDNIHESSDELAGAFLGVLPHRRSFEFQVADTAEVISGRVGKDVAEPAAINRVLEQRLTIRVQRRRVGDGRPRYVLLGYDAVAAAPQDDEPGHV